MGIPQPHEKSILFVGALFSKNDILDASVKVLKEKFGNILFQSDTYPWNFTNYYDKELGTPIYRNFIFFDNIIDPSILADAKLITNEIELNFSEADKRQINLDPGYVAPAKVVLASTKNYSHRIYLGKGIYAELTLIYKDGKFTPLPYTYTDYRVQTFLEIFLEARGLLKSIIKGQT